MSYDSLSFLKMAAILNLQLFFKFYFLSADSLSGLICNIVPKFMVVGQNIAEMQLFLTIL